ncbi:MAG: tRNA (adenosine(37)-N6)-threonylcarbamoyltransferase complex ATPase subunit type 1 TsaE [Bacteroidota bacterium]|nr:tRNA (adenosine(37)-N6)-threonylcarbamoyltransferase complex ATPase subunit type 1 TsaE [Bacteroidota bacterium]MEE3245184.1 tRNA (adenosine(37)-N6)-threonylcarbamoyltransferase complex ATPase subunit type 1 TsaE [Bacteroidota bacterium]HCW65038.1 tRNA (adenosine(37)-N6)-threonylcarbamoyltransferase complex ATPase subunit type 1 TsaE [Leeuwenhoekiella sp.]|tara:strand:+ start:128 stop:535 length:408 start_codon:yes stop_codon:yes gene_type:complete
MEYTYALDQIDEVAEALIKNLKFSTILFYGDLGAGKTTLIKALVKRLGSADNVSSPTFSLINEYKTDAGASIFHLDLYRLKDENEAYDLGIEELLETDSLKLIEWPQKINSLLNNEVHSARIFSTKDNVRTLKFL